MVMRLAFAIAIQTEADIFLIDEALAVGDAEFQQKCLDKFVEFKEKGKSMVLVSHDMERIRRTLCRHQASRAECCVRSDSSGPRRLHESLRSVAACTASTMAIFARPRRVLSGSTRSITVA